MAFYVTWPFKLLCTFLNQLSCFVTTMLTCGTNRPDPTDSYMMAMLGVQALGLQSVAVDVPEALKGCHPLLSYLYSRDAAVVEAAKARLTLVDETVTSMVDETKSAKTAVSGVLPRNTI